MSLDVTSASTFNGGYGSKNKIAATITKKCSLKAQKLKEKKETLTQVSSCEFWEISKNAFSYRTSPVAAFKSCYS